METVENLGQRLTGQTSTMDIKKMREMVTNTTAWTMQLTKCPLERREWEGRKDNETEERRKEGRYGQMTIVR